MSAVDDEKNPLGTRHNPAMTCKELRNATGIKDGKDR